MTTPERPITQNKLANSAKMSKQPDTAKRQFKALPSLTSEEDSASASRLSVPEKQLQGVKISGSKRELLQGLVQSVKSFAPIVSMRDRHKTSAVKSPSNTVSRGSRSMQNSKESENIKPKVIVMS